MRDTFYLLGVDIGGTNVKFGLVDRQGKIFASGLANVSFDRYKTPIMTTVIRELKAFLSDSLTQNRIASELGQQGVRPCGVAVSATGQIDTEKGLVTSSCGHLPGWSLIPVQDIFERELGYPTLVANDANCMILGEAWLGAGRGQENIVGITIGTGLGGGIVMNGQLFLGSTGMAGEFGHMPLYADGQLCTCGQRGCAEQYISITALHRRAKAAGCPFNTTMQLCRNLKSGKASPAQVKMFAAWRADIAHFLVGLVHAFNPQLIIIGGGISQQEALLIAPVRELVFQQIMPSFGQDLEVKAAGLGNQAGLIGACKLWQDTFKA